MTTGGVSKKVFFGVLLANAITEIATTDTTPGNKIIYVYVLAGLLIFYFSMQAFLDFKGTKDTQDN